MKLIGVALYLLILLIIGAVASRQMKDLRDYYAGGKRFGFWAAAFSSRATGESAWLLIGLTGMGAAVGAQAFWIVIGEVLGVAAAWSFLCGRFKRLTDRYDSITIGLFIAIVLAAIMSTVDSLLVLASSALVRDYYQKVRHPEMSDEQLLGRSRTVTFVLAAVALVMAFSVAALVPGRTVFWFAIFGWSGISATFCPTMIFSLFWSRLTARGALAAMLSGFASVPFFKFVGPQLPVVGNSLAALSELPPAFLVSGMVAIVVSLFDRQENQWSSEIQSELADCGNVERSVDPWNGKK